MSTNAAALMDLVPREAAGAGVQAADGIEDLEQLPGILPVRGLPVREVEEIVAHEGAHRDAPLRRGGAGPGQRATMAAARAIR